MTVITQSVWGTSKYSYQDWQNVFRLEAVLGSHCANVIKHYAVNYHVPPVPSMFINIGDMLEKADQTQTQKVHRSKSQSKLVLILQ